MLTDISFTMCMRVVWDKMATKDGFVCYLVTGREGLRLEEESVQAINCTCRSPGNSTNVMFVAVPVLIRANRGQAGVGVIFLIYDEYRSLIVHPEPASVVDRTPYSINTCYGPRPTIPSKYQKRVGVLPGY